MLRCLYFSESSSHSSGSKTLKIFKACGISTLAMESSKTWEILGVGMRVIGVEIWWLYNIFFDKIMSSASFIMLRCQLLPVAASCCQLLSHPSGMISWMVPPALLAKLQMIIRAPFSEGLKMPKVESKLKPLKFSLIKRFRVLAWLEYSEDLAEFVHFTGRAFSAGRVPPPPGLNFRHGCQCALEQAATSSQA